MNKQLVFGAIAAFVAGAAITSASLADPQAPLSNATLTQWLGTYGKAWETRDAKAAAAIFSEDASYRETPYDEPFEGRQGIRDYWSNVTRDQRNVHFQSRVIAVTANTGIAHWSADFDVVNSQEHVELDGIFVLEFDGRGLCSRLEEWWHLRSNNPATPEK